MIPVNLPLQDIRAPAAVIVTYVPRDLVIFRLQCSKCFKSLSVIVASIWPGCFIFCFRDQLNHWRSKEQIIQVWPNVTCSDTVYWPSICPSDVNISLAPVIFVHHVLNSSAVRYNSTENKFDWMRVHRPTYASLAVAASGHPWESCIQLNMVRPIWRPFCRRHYQQHLLERQLSSMDLYFTQI